MDGLLNKGKEMLSGNKNTTQQPAGQGAQGQGQNQDYLDKGINAVEGKFGFDKDHKYDKYEEKGTDMLRGKFESSTGKKVPEKFSN